MNCYDSPDSKANPVLRDAKFRQALNYAVDLRKLVKVVWLGLHDARDDASSRRTTTRTPTGTGSRRRT